MQDETRWGWSWRHDKAQARWSLDKGPGFAGWKYYGSDFCTLASIQEAENLVPRFARKSGCRRCAYKGWLLPFPHLLSHDRGIFKEQVSWLIAWHSIIARLPCLAWSCLQWTRVRDLVGPGGMRWLGVHSLGGGLTQDFGMGHSMSLVAPTTERGPLLPYMLMCIGGGKKFSFFVWCNSLTCQHWASQALRLFLSSDVGPQLQMTKEAMWGLS